MGMIGDLFVKLGLDKKSFDKGVDEAKTKINDFGTAVSSASKSLLGVFGSGLDEVKNKLTGLIGHLTGVYESFKFAAQGGQAAADANKLLAIANGEVAATQKALTAAQEALTALQASGTVTAEAEAAAQAELAAASKAANAALKGQTVAQEALTVATSAGAIAANILKVALVSTGIGALVVVVGSLVAYFTQTREGAKMIKIALAEVGAVVRVLVDRFSSFGEGIVKLFTGDWKGMSKAFRDAFNGMGDEIKKEAAAAGDLAKRQSEINKLERDSIVLQQERRTQIAQLRAEAKEEGKTGKERIELLDKAKQLIKETSALDIKIAAENAAIAIAKRQMHKESADELRQDQEDRAKVLKLQEEEAMQLKALSREYKAASNARKQEIEAEIALAEYAATVGARPSTMNMANPFTGKADKPQTAVENGKFTYSGKGILNDEVAGLQKSTWIEKQYTAALAKRKIEMDNEKAAMSQFNDEFTGLIQSGMSSAVDTFASGIEALASGEFNMKDFGKSLLVQVADFLVKFGELLIGFAVASKGFQTAIQNLGGWQVALVAGVALVAIGSAIKGHLSKGVAGASGSYTGSPSVASSAGGLQSASSGQTVEFKIQGSTLVGVLQNAQTMRGITG